MIQMDNDIAPIRGVQGSRETATTDRSRETALHLKPTAGAEAGKRRLVVFLMPVR